MSDGSAIEWTDATWNPIRVASHRWYCEKISPGCDNCYASTFNRRMGGEAYPNATGKPLPVAQPPILHYPTLDRPSSWRKPRRVFVCSMSDLFGEWVPFEWIDAIFVKMWRTPHHTFQLLTKRPRRMLDFLEYRRERLAADDIALEIPAWPANVWAGVTIEHNRYAWRADLLRAVPAAVRWVSAEPLLAQLHDLNLRGIHWLVAGGESGGPPERRLVRKCLGCGGCQPARWSDNWCHGTGWSPKPDALEAVRALRDRCVQEGVAFFFKQWGGPHPKSGGRLLDGQVWSQSPEGVRA